ncbi:hypothetical protein QQX98_007213 [Neonectria punicea]|uniref:Uncharacterized protein n=1 Tax=Neonectria punicea TaxID=979145 RepID=A0ABR1GZ91_9HYPO
MDPPSTEHRPEETTPLLASTGSQREGETEAIQRPPTSTVQYILSIGFPICVVLSILILAFLLAENLLNQYGATKFNYIDWTMEHAGQPLFWTSLSSIALSVVNMIYLKRTHKPLSAIFNAIFLVVLAGVVTLTVSDILGISQPTYCREHEDDYAPYSFPGDDSSPDDPQFNGLIRRPFEGSLEECKQWAPKIQAVRGILIYLAGFHAAILWPLFFAAMVDVIPVTQRFIKRVFATTSSKLGPGNISFEVSLKWGPPHRHEIAQHQFEDGITVQRRETEST